MKTKLTITIFTNETGKATTVDKYYDEYLSLPEGTGLVIGGRDSNIGKAFLNTQTDTIQYFCKYIDVNKDYCGDFMIALANEGWKY